MKKNLSLFCAVCAVFILSCGGSSSSSSDVSTDDVSAISTALTGTLNDCMSETTPSTLEADDLVVIDGGSFTNAVNLEHSCPVDGHITASGNISGTWTDSYSGSYSSMITFQVSDPTNNLNDCEVRSGIILDGTIYLTLNGSYSGASNTYLATIIGTVGINRRGETGGLVMVASDCYISLRFTESGASGSICGHDVSS